MVSPTKLQSNIQFLLEINSVSVKKRNTKLVTLSLLDKLLPALEEKKFALCVFLDYSVVLSLCPAYFYLTSWKDKTYVT